MIEEKERHRTPLQGGLVLEQLVEEGSIPVPDAHRVGADVLEDVYGSPQTSVHKVSIPGWVALPGHVDLDEGSLGGDGPTRRIGGLCGSHLEHRQTSVCGGLLRLAVVP